MGKKAWIYESSLPASIADDLNADGYESPSSPGVRASFEEKQAALEKYSLSASGDLDQETDQERLRITAATRAHRLKARMSKIQAGSRRMSSWSSCSFDDAIQRELGLDVAWPETDKRCSSEVGQTSRRSSYSGLQFPNLDHKDTQSSEPIVISTVSDLLRHLDKMGRLQPPLSSLTMPTNSSVPFATDSGTESEPGDIPFLSHSSAESESDACESYAGPNVSHVSEEVSMGDASDVDLEPPGTD